MPRFFAVVIAALTAVFVSPACIAQPAGRSLPVPCEDATAVVTGAGYEDFRDICAGAAAAVTFLASLDVPATEPVSIEVTNSIPHEAGPTAAGCYIEQHRKVFVLPYSAFRRSKTWIGVAIDRTVYRALAAHEAAHAVAACSFRSANPTIQAKEYLAYATTFATMALPLRTKALKATGAEGFTSLDRFTPLLYMFNPMRFGAESYLHFSKVSDKPGLVRSILDGKLLTD
jgi:hypothetical protein